MFSAQVRAYRQRRGMTQEQLAARTGVSARSIHNLEAGRIKHPRLGTVGLLADAFALAGAERERFFQSALDDLEPHQEGETVGSDIDTGPERGRPAPAQLPADVAAFVGRTDHLRQLTALLDGGDRPATVVISAIAGTAGVGKTALAVHWAHQTLDRFPGGQLYVNLRGYDPDQPANPGDVLARFLTALGVPGPDIPADLDARAARYRTELAGRRMLIVLDNAATVDQVRPLLPGTGSAMVLVTSRDSLAGLVAVHGAHRLDLDLVPPSDAVALLRRLIGQRVEAAPDAASALAAQCAHLPLALRVAAELAVARPAMPLTEVVAELADQQRRLDLLDADGDPRAAVAAVFSWSMRHLPADAARTFRLLGLHPGPDFDAYAVAALSDTGLPQARRALDRLARAHLVHPTGPGRYGMHDLLHAYATSLTAMQDSEADRQAASIRLFDYYLATAAVATQHLHPADIHGRCGIAALTTPTPHFADPDAARRWLDTERPCLVATAAHTATRGLPGHAVRLSATLYRYLEGGHFIDALAIQGHARDAARQAGDPAGQAHALIGLGVTNALLGWLEPAKEHFVQALALFRQTGDQIGEARVLGNLGSLEIHLGRYEEAADHHAQALILSRHTGYIRGEACSLDNLGVIKYRRGRYQEAVDDHELALALFQQLGDLRGAAAALNNFGVAEVRRGRYQEAVDRHEHALTLSRQLGNPRSEAWSLDGLGSVYTRLGRLDQATTLHQQALTLFQETGERDGEAQALNGLGEAALAAGRATAALTHHTTALSTSALPDQRARAHTGLGHAHRALGDPASARHHYEHALALYTHLGTGDIDDVRAHLTALEAQPDTDYHQYADCPIKGGADLA